VGGHGSAGAAGRDADLEPVGFGDSDVMPRPGSTRAPNRPGDPGANAHGGRGPARHHSDIDTPRWSKRKASVWPLVVVVPHVLVEHSLKMTPTPDQHPVQTLLSYRPHPALRERVGIRRLDRVMITRVPSLANTSSKTRVNLLSRSQMSNQGVVMPSGRSIDSSRARWTTHGPFERRATRRAEPAKRAAR
jgi:hypothetical protein